MAKKIFTAFTGAWKLLIVFNLLLSAAGLWLAYSQNVFLSQITASSLALTPLPGIPGQSQTATVLGSPLSTQAFMITSLTGISLAVSVIIVGILFWLFREK